MPFFIVGKVYRLFSPNVAGGRREQPFTVFGLCAVDNKFVREPIMRTGFYPFVIPNYAVSDNHFSQIIGYKNGYVRQSVFM